MLQSGAKKVKTGVFDKKLPRPVCKITGPGSRNADAIYSGYVESLRNRIPPSIIFGEHSDNDFVVHTSDTVEKLICSIPR